MADVLDAKDAEQSSRPEADDVKLEEEDLVKRVGEIEVDVEAPAIPALGSGSGSGSAALSASPPTSPPSTLPPSTSLSTSPSGSASASSSASTSTSTSTSNQPNTAQGQAQEGDDNSTDDDDDDSGPLGPEYLFDYEKTPRQPDSPTTVPITVYPPVSPPPRTPSPPRTSDFQPIPVNSTTVGRPYTAPSLSTREPEYIPVAFSPAGFPTYYRSSCPNPPSSPIPALLGPAGPTHELAILIHPGTGIPTLDPVTGDFLFRARPISANDSARRLRNLPALPPPAAPKEPESDTKTPKTLARNATVTDTAPIAGPSKTSIPPGPPSPRKQQQSKRPNSAPAKLPSGKMAPKVPKPGPARLGPRAGLDEWLEQAKLCRYLPESAMKQLCEMVKECLMEESNIQPVRTPVTICGDIHGQFFDLLELFRVSGGMPGETNVQAPTTMISSDDFEPPTDPSLKNISSGGDSGLGSSVSSGTENDGEESRGRPRTAGSSRSASSGASSTNANMVTGSGKQNFIFLGDFVDRGYFSLETLTLLMCLKAKYPDRITLVRGNHESRQITQVYGFYEECQQKYGNASVWKACCQVFDFLILAAIVDGAVLCVHGGLSPEIRTLDQIRVVARAQEIPHEGAFCDLVWSDPEDVETWAVSPRGAGWLFGDKVASEFNQVNGLKLIARAHQLVNEGYKYHFQQKSVVTVWSAPNYCYRCGNVASIMNVGEDLEPKFSIFSAVPEDQRAVPAGRRGAGEYFL